jgi:hypothetical protein
MIGILLDLETNGTEDRLVIRPARIAHCDYAVWIISRRAAPACLVDVGDRFGLPELPQRPIVLHANVSDPHARDMLMSLTAKMRTEATGRVDETG